jgi:hypothetical protein
MRSPAPRMALTHRVGRTCRWRGVTCRCFMRRRRQAPTSTARQVVLEMSCLRWPFAGPEIGLSRRDEIARLGGVLTLIPLLLPRTLSVVTLKKCEAARWNLCVRGGELFDAEHAADFYCDPRCRDLAHRRYLGQLETRKRPAPVRRSTTSVREGFLALADQALPGESARRNDEREADLIVRRSLALRSRPDLTHLWPRDH